MDTSQFTPTQHELMGNLSDRWSEVRATGAQDVDALVACAEAAWRALLDGGAWPGDVWVEEILMIGANACASAVLNHGQYLRLKDACGGLHQEVLDRRWLHGGPSGRLEQSEVEGLGRAVGQWQVYSPPADTAPPPAKRRWFGRGQA